MIGYGLWLRLGPQAVLFAAGATLVVGALLGLGIVAGRLVAHLDPRPDQPRLEIHPTPRMPVCVRKEQFPYAVAIAGGSLICLTQSGRLAALAAVIPGGAS